MGPAHRPKGPAGVLARILRDWLGDVHVCFRLADWVLLVPRLRRSFAQAGAHNTGTMYALRFLIGLFESAFFPVGMSHAWLTGLPLISRPLPACASMIINDGSRRADGAGILVHPDGACKADRHLPRERPALCAGHRRRQGALN